METLSVEEIWKQVLGEAKESGITIEEVKKFIAERKNKDQKEESLESVEVKE